MTGSHASGGESHEDFARLVETFGGDGYRTACFERFQDLGEEVDVCLAVGGDGVGEDDEKGGERGKEDYPSKFSIASIEDWVVEAYQPEYNLMLGVSLEANFAKFFTWHCRP